MNQEVQAAEGAIHSPFFAGRSGTVGPGVTSVGATAPSDRRQAPVRPWSGAHRAAVAWRSLGLSSKFHFHTWYTAG